MSGKKAKNKKELIITFANEPSKEAIQAYSEAVNKIILNHIRKEDNKKS